MAARPRLLFVAPWFLFPRVSGGRIRTTDVLRGMKGGAFEITLASPAPADGRDWSAELASICDHFVGWRDDTRRSALRRVLHLASPLPVSVALDRSPNARACLARELARGPDVVVFDFVHTAVLLPDDALPMRAVAFTHNVESEIFARDVALARNPLARAVWRSQHRKMTRFERAALRRADAVVAVSERDAERFRRELGIETVHAIPTGVDLDFYAFRPRADGGDATSAGRLVFTGSMDWRPNIDALEWLMREAWDAIVASSPQAALTIVGRDPPGRLIAAAQQRGLRWTFTGRVEDVRPFIRTADACVIPIRAGGGTRLKVYEAMALGCPVVSTGIGAEGLPIADGEHYLRADAGRDFAAAVRRLLGDAALRARLATAARAHVEANGSLQRVGRAFEAICLEGVTG
ncbi:MAG: glycosyltransferase [Deltaproteobacteria bacterium]|nr:glycosyltransferase [Deltaproteobacteria bacterium]